MEDVILCFLCLLKQNKTKIVYFDVNDIGILLETCFYNCSFPFSFNQQIIHIYKFLILSGDIFIH
jgi:hypothetical protein